MTKQYDPAQLGSVRGRDRNASYPAPLAQIPAGATNAPGSCLEFWRQSELPDTDG